MSDQKTINVYDDQVENYAKLINELPEDKLLLAFIAQLKPDNYVLDLGCGPAISSALMREHGLTVDPVDASKEMVKLANATYDINARVALFDEIDCVNTYDGIWANFSLLHASEASFPNILKKLHRSLKPNGLFHLGMKLGDGSKRDNLERLYTYYSEEHLLNYIKSARFTIDSISYGEDLGLAGEVEPWIAITSSANV